MSAPATLLMWFQLRSPEMAEAFELLQDAPAHLVSTRGMLVLRPVLGDPPASKP
jgi:hypothetical protein